MLVTRKETKLRNHGSQQTMTGKINAIRKWKSKNDEEGRTNYRKLNNELRRETDKAKEQWWENECRELEKLDKKRAVRSGV